MQCMCNIVFAQFEKIIDEEATEKRKNSLTRTLFSERGNLRSDRHKQIERACNSNERNKN